MSLDLVLKKTEELHVSNVINLLLNFVFFLYCNSLETKRNFFLLSFWSNEYRSYIYFYIGLYRVRINTNDLAYHIIFLLSSLIVYDSSAALFVLGKHLNSFSFTPTYYGDEYSNWINCFPKREIIHSVIFRKNWERYNTCIKGGLIYLNFKMAIFLI
ncbi:hypothetical protein MERGE_000463 [Pneumocystis wakefieldiae]|uniref:Uncharacterized protein n=1 Tax=Pneumocystis wakefieldiae TaxID=38082 RepID=A0A899G3Q6_9ASCO|nr:hypothetical protein MERGE_000463 [Pneumocystis wakefieldiae]